MNVKFRENVFDVIIHSGRADVETGLQSELKAIVGVPIATALLAYLIMSKKVQEFFSKSRN